MTLRNKIIFKLNSLYSTLWIAVTGTDKFEYRDRSHIHSALMSLYKI